MEPISLLIGVVALAVIGMLAGAATYESLATPSRTRFARPTATEAEPPHIPDGVTVGLASLANVLAESNPVLPSDSEQSPQRPGAVGEQLHGRAEYVQHRHT
ncbi:MAG: hypothetical protein HY820_22100 [Acidobacteria bacterium]|nr:hypothetical protein [Acidobacteriota bacterium]